MYKEERSLEAASAIVQLFDVLMQSSGISIHPNSRPPSILITVPPDESRDFFIDFK